MHENGLVDRSYTTSCMTEEKKYYVYR